MSIIVKNITKSFGKKEALKEVTFSIKKGEVVGFLGPNGAGKSTLMRILTTYYKADKGEAQVNGLVFKSFEVGAGVVIALGLGLARLEAGVGLHAVYR